MCAFVGRTRDKTTQENLYMANRGQFSFVRSFVGSVSSRVILSVRLFVLSMRLLVSSDQSSFHSFLFDDISFVLPACAGE